MKQIFTTAFLVFLILPGLMAQYSDMGEIEGDTAIGRFGTSSALNYDGSVLISGTYAIGGGKAQVFEWSNNTWIQRGNDITGLGQFGWAVDMNAAGDMVVISAKKYDGNSLDQGQVKVYEWDGSNWNQKGSELLGPTAGDEFGYDVAMDSSGLTIVVGAPSYDFINADGLVEVYDWDGSDWKERGSGISTPVQGAGTGLAVDISGDGNTIAYSIPFLGDVDVREWVDTSWVMVGSSITGAPPSSFGNDVQLSYDGKTVAVGAPTQDTDEGNAEAFKWINGSWTSVGSIDGLNPGDFAGSTIALSRDGNFLAVGSRYSNSRGHVRVWHWDGSAFVNYDAAINAGGEDMGEEFSRSISMNYNGSIMCVGAHKFNGAAGSETGIVRVSKACLESKIWYDGSSLRTTDLSYASYQWLDCDNNLSPITNANSAQFSPSVDGNYAVIVTGNGCSDTTTCLNAIATSAPSPEWQQAVKIYPNPTQGKLHLDLGDLQVQTLVLRNALGQEILQMEGVSGMIDLQIPGPAGIYFLEVKSKNGLTTNRVLKQ